MKAYAKINLTLNVLKKLPSGYHEVESVLQQIELHDAISIIKIDNGIVIKCNNPNAPLDNKNLSYKAAELLKNKFNIKEGVEINIEKNIPISAGLSGGSTDAGAVLTLINNLFKLNLQKEELMKLAAEIGMDVPFSVLGGAAIAKARGEILEKIESMKMDVLLINPGFEISTREAYQSLDLTKCGKNINTNEMLEAVNNKNIKKIATNLHNDFEYTVIKKYPIIDKIKKDLIENGTTNALMSGSGATVFGIFENNAKEAFENLKDRYNFVYLTKTK